MARRRRCEVHLPRHAARPSDMGGAEKIFVTAALPEHNIGATVESAADVGASSAKTQLFPVADVLTIAVHATNDCVLVAVDSHPILYGRDGNEAGVKVFRRHPVSLASLGSSGRRPRGSRAQ